MRIKIQFVCLFVFKMGKTAARLSANIIDPKKRKEMLMLKRKELLEG